MRPKFILIMTVFVFSVLGSAPGYGAAKGPQNQSVEAVQLADRQVDVALPEGASAGWWAAVQQQIRRSEYKISWQDQTYLPDVKAAYQVPNRAHNLRTYFTPTGIRVIPRTEASPSWQWGMSLTGYGYSGHAQPVEAATLAVSGNRIEYRRGELTEWYVNDERGIEQGFTLKNPPGSGNSSPGSSVVLVLELSGDLTPRPHRSGDEIDFSNSDGQNAIRYGKLHASDASGKNLRAAVSVNDRQLSLSIETTGARYPITIDPIIWGGSSEPDWTYTGPYGSMEAKVGHSVSTAGDVNGDGYSDVIVGAPFWDTGATNEGQIFVFYGSASGLSTGISWSAEGNQANAAFGIAVSTAGDVNGDGYADVIVGASGYYGGENYEGAAFVYHGSAGGLSTNPDWTVEGNQANAYFGNAVGTAGDVNGDGFGDIIVGAYYYDNGHLNEGAVFVYHGSPTGLSATAWFAESNNYQAYFGVSVATAGDVNGDGYGDIIVGAYYYTHGETDEGAAFVFHGSSTGLNLNGDRPSGNPGNADWMEEGEQSSRFFGGSVSTAGDVNGDGYADVVIGAHNYTAYGTAFVYHGSATGLTSTYQWYARGDVVGGHFGGAVATAGDMNGDGYADIIVGSKNYDNGETNEGAAFVYLGSSTGLDLNGTRPSGNPGNCDWMEEGDQDEAYFGWSVATAGDVNADGYADVIVGTPGYDRGIVPPKVGVDTGRATVYHGSATGLNTSAHWDTNLGVTPYSYCISVGTAGDINGDGYVDVIVGAPGYDNGEAIEGAAFVYLGSASGLSFTSHWMAESNLEDARFGWSVATAGDVNGDGYADVIVGAPEYIHIEDTDWGAAFVYHGSATGLGPDGSPDNADWRVISRLYTGNDYGGHFGLSVATAGDVNGDGYADVIVGAPDVYTYPGYRSHVTVFHGSAAGLSTMGDRFDMDSDDENGFGDSVGTAGDVNGDGYSDIIIGASRYGDDDAGAAFVHHGSASGLSTSPDWTAAGSNSGLDRFGISAGTAGDVNGDGYADVIVGAYNYDNGELNEGAAFVYHGSDTGLSTTENWLAEGDQDYAAFGYSLGTAGDVNGDGYADVIVGAWMYYNGENNEGAAFVYHGSTGGLSTNPDWTVEGNEVDAYFGLCVGTAGDVNGDGYADVIVGLNYNRARAYNGNGGGLSLNPRQRKSDDSAPIAHLGMSDSEDAFSLSVLGRTPYGRGLVKLEWEVKPLGTFFDGTGTQESTAWTDIGATGAEINELVETLSANTLYHWRMRLHYHPATTPFQQYGRWLTMPWNGWQEADLRTKAYDDPPVIDSIVFDNCISECPTCPDSVISVTAHDPAGGSLSYSYTPSDGGTIIGSGANVAFDPPDSGPHPCPYQVEVEVESNASGLSTSQTIAISVKLAGDVDGNGVVNVLDKVQVRNYFGQSGDPGFVDADVNCDGVVNILDKVQVRNQFGQTGCSCL